MALDIDTMVRAFGELIQRDPAPGAGFFIVVGKNVCHQGITQASKVLAGFLQGDGAFQNVER